MNTNISILWTRLILLIIWFLILISWIIQRIIIKIYIFAIVLYYCWTDLVFIVAAHYITCIKLLVTKLSASIIKSLWISCPIIVVTTIVYVFWVLASFFWNVLSWEVCEICLCSCCIGIGITDFRSVIIIFIFDVCCANKSTMEVSFLVILVLFYALFFLKHLKRLLQTFFWFGQFIFVCNWIA